MKKNQFDFHEYRTKGLPGLKTPYPCVRYLEVAQKFRNIRPGSQMRQLRLTIPKKPQFIEKLSKTV